MSSSEFVDVDVDVGWKLESETDMPIACPCPFWWAYAADILSEIAEGVSCEYEGEG